MALIPKTARAEMANSWREVIEGARKKPNPFIVVSCDQGKFRSWGMFLFTKSYKSKHIITTRLIKQLRITQFHTQTIEHRSTYHWTVLLIPHSWTREEEKRGDKDTCQTRAALPRTIPSSKRKVQRSEGSGKILRGSRVKAVLQRIAGFLSYDNDQRINILRSEFMKGLDHFIKEYAPFSYLNSSNNPHI